MNRSRHTRAARPAFTLVELLVVIAIIAILVGLISAAVVKALSTGNQTANMADIRKMAAAVQAFQTQFKVPYIPSRIVLCKYRAHYDPNNPLHRDSLAFLDQMWPRLQWTTLNGAQTAFNRIDWDGTPGGGPPSAPQPPGANKSNVFMLDGGQCLVFFLGGIPLAPSVGTTPGTLGFSTNPANPTVGSERVSPFYEFKSNRLRIVDGFYYYLDTYGNRPYAYFSSSGKRNGYNKYFATLRNSDCSNPGVYGLATGVWPLAEQLAGTPRYLNPDSFQIISAGANEVFGSGTVLTAGAPLWSYQNPGAAYTGSTNGSDDQSNFHNLLLGVPAE